MSYTPPPDVMDQLAGLAPDAPLAALRRQRPDVVQHTNGSEAAVFTPGGTGYAGFQRHERVAAALRIAILLRDATMEAHYRARLERLDPTRKFARSADEGPPAVSDPRWAAILTHVDRVTIDPDGAKKAHIDGLLQAGLTPQDVVSLSQLIAYVNYQSRVLAGLRMLQGAS